MATSTSMTTNNSTTGTNGIARRSAQQPEKLQARRTFAPLVDIYENADELLLIADMPGVNRDGVTVNLEKMELTIEGKRARGEEEGNVVAAESEPLDYRRSFLLPHGIDADKIAADLSHGVLRVRLPKSAALKPRQIQVKAG